MPLVLILFLGVWVPIVGLSTAADTVTPAHRQECWRPADHGSPWNHARMHWDVPGWRWLFPYPVRRGKYHIDFAAGDTDTCTGETFNGKWWYRP